jgi:hypoxanthine phosphoribosyltransferase
MIDYKTIKDFNEDTHEGKLLLAAIAVLTSVDHEDIKSQKWGGMTHPDTAMEQIVELANKIFYEEEWKLEQERIKRDNKINKILKDE